MAAVDCYPTIDGKNCLDPGTLAEQIDEHNLPNDFWYRANSYECPRGPDPGRAWFLITRKDLDAIDKNLFVPAIFRSNQGNVTIAKLLFFKATCMSAGISPTDQAAAYLAEFVDPRHVLAMSTIGSGTAGAGQYNCRLGAVEGATSTDLYFSESLNSGSLWTWAGLIADLWAKLPSGPAGSAPTLPYTPDGSPEGFRFVGVSAWQALHEVLEKISCTTKYNPITNLFSIIKLGSTQSSLTSTLDGLAERLLYSFWPVEGNAARVPETIRVFFHRYDEHFAVTIDTPRTGSASMQPAYSVDKASGSSGAIAGTILSLWDDLPAIYDKTATLTNSSALSARATEVAANLVLSMTTGDARMKRKFSGIVDTVLPGEEITKTIWRDYGEGEGVVTEVMNYKPAADVPSWLGPGSRKVAERLATPDLGRATLVAHPTKLLGKITTSALAVGGSATIAIWRWNGSAYVDTTVTLTAYDWLMKTGATSISVGKKVIIEYFADSSRWFVTEAECE